MKVGELIALLQRQDEEKEVYVDLVDGSPPTRKITHVMDNQLGKVVILARNEYKGK